MSLNTDEFVLRYKGRSPTMSLEDRAVMLQSCRYVDKVIVNFGCEDSKPAIRRIHPDVIVAAGWGTNDLMRQMSLTVDWLEEMGIRIVQFPYTDGVSTTEIRSAIENENSRDLPNLPQTAHSEHSGHVESTEP